MATFQYTAHREDQTTVEGRLEADDLESARRSLQERGLVVAAIHQIDITLSDGAVHSLFADPYTYVAGTVTVDGRAFTIDDTSELNDHLRPGHEIVVGPDATLDLVVDGTVMYEVVAGTRMTLPESPGRWFGRAVALPRYGGPAHTKR